MIQHRKLTIPLDFVFYKQTISDGACELYAMIFGFMHTSMRKELEEQISIDENNNVTVNFKHLKLKIVIKQNEIDKILEFKAKNKKKGITQYYPSKDPMIIALGLAYQKAMSQLPKLTNSKRKKELLGAYGKDHGYAVTHLDWEDGKKKPNTVADLILNKQVDYLPHQARVQLDKDGKLYLINKNIIEQYAQDLTEVFIIRPVGNHAVLYYYENGQWHEFNNQRDALDHLSETIDFTAEDGGEAIRIIHINEYDPNPNNRKKHWVQNTSSISSVNQPSPAPTGNNNNIDEKKETVEKEIFSPLTQWTFYGDHKSTNKEKCNSPTSDINPFESLITKKTNAELYRKIISPGENDDHLRDDHSSHLIVQSKGPGIGPPDETYLSPLLSSEALRERFILQPRPKQNFIDRLFSTARKPINTETILAEVYQAKKLNNEFLGNGLKIRIIVDTDRAVTHNLEEVMKKSEEDDMPLIYVNKNGVLNLYSKSNLPGQPSAIWQNITLRDNQHMFLFEGTDEIFKLINDADYNDGCDRMITPLADRNSKLIWQLNAFHDPENQPFNKNGDYYEFLKTYYERFKKTHGSKRARIVASTYNKIFPIEKDIDGKSIQNTPFPIFHKFYDKEEVRSINDALKLHSDLEDNVINMYRPSINKIINKHEVLSNKNGKLENKTFSALIERFNDYIKNRKPMNCNVLDNAEIKHLVLGFQNYFIRLPEYTQLMNLCNLPGNQSIKNVFSQTLANIFNAKQISECVIQLDIDQALKIDNVLHANGPHKAEYRRLMDLLLTKSRKYIEKNLSMHSGPIKINDFEGETTTWQCVNEKIDVLTVVKKQLGTINSTAPSPQKSTFTFYSNNQGTKDLAKTAKKMCDVITQCDPGERTSIEKTLKFIAINACSQYAKNKNGPEGGLFKNIANLMDIELTLRQIKEAILENINYFEVGFVWDKSKNLIDERDIIDIDEALVPSGVKKIYDIICKADKPDEDKLSEILSILREKLNETKLTRFKSTVKFYREIYKLFALKSGDEFTKAMQDIISIPPGSSVTF